LEIAVVKVGKPIKQKIGLRTDKKPLCVRYAEILRLRQRLAEVQSAQSTKTGRPALKN
jgi:hypothetical protein